MSDIDYTYFYKNKLDSISELSTNYDFFLSFYSDTERVKTIFENIVSKTKVWISKELNLVISPEKHFITQDELSENDNVYNLLNDLKISSTDKLCIDITSFPIPFLFLLLKNLQFSNILYFDIIYTEPVTYNQKEHTIFSEEFMSVKQIEGYEGTHNTSDDSNDFLIIASGYDHSRVIDVCKNKSHTRKIQVFGLPSLQPDFYQENIIKTEKASEELAHPNFNDFDLNIFAPANDPFVTAQELKLFIQRQNNRKVITNLYLSPLSTKAQALGFALYYLWECENMPVSIIYPFCNGDIHNTSNGISNISVYNIELPEALI
ncbi:hypothetical protein [Flavobacterium faecale]|uniref:hypothetical protein n=1 Tax=Flavobacterium faecale TaxID=1355330 RepID=UPI003AAC0956